MRLLVAVLVLLAALALSCASAGRLGGAALDSAGQSSQFRSEDNYGNYQFGYDEAHASGGSGRREERQGEAVRGSYSLADADGRQRIVNYLADHTGFHASIQTNEPGVDAARDPADVLINKQAHALAVPVAHAGPLLAAPLAPLPAAPVFRAPVYAAAAAAAAVPVVVKTAHQLVSQAPVYEEVAPAVQAYEAATPRAFSYSFGSSHPALSYAAAPAFLAQQAALKY